MRLLVLAAVFLAFPALACDSAICAVDAVASPFAAAGKLSGTLLIRHGDALILRSYDLADDGWGTPNSLGTIFAIASCSKGFVAATVLKLVDDSKLRLDDKAADYLPEYPRRNLSRAGREVTIRDLLTHESGIPEAYDAPSIDQRMDKVALTFADMIGAVDNHGLQFTPGSRFEYSNTGYVLLGEIVRRVSGTTSEIFLRENFLEKLGLDATTVTPPVLPTDTVARSYIRQGGHRIDYQQSNRLVAIAGQEVFADTNIYTSAPDLAKWAEAITSGAALSAASTQSMLTPSKGEYGFGWIIYHDDAGRLAYEHAGDYGGFQSWVRRYPDAGFTVVWLSNQAMRESDLAKFYEGVANAALTGTW